MFTFLKDELNYIEIILIFSGLLILASTVYIVAGGDLSINFIAKAFYILGATLLVLKT